MEKLNQACVWRELGYGSFGMALVGRNWSVGSEYRYGFNGKEQDPETFGDGNIYDYGFRIYNPRLGKFLSVDPLTKSYAELTPYQFASNRPIDGIDLDGLEYYVYHILIDKRRGFVKLEKIEDLTNMSEEDVKKIHGISKAEFLEKHSVTYGVTGQNNAWVYTIIDKKGNSKTLPAKLSENSTLQLGIFQFEHYGLFSGSGAITKWGPMFKHNFLKNPYALWRKPIDMGDALALGHDKAENEFNYAGRMSTKYLKADILFVRGLELFLKNAEDPNYIDPYTNRPPSEDAIAYAKVAIDYFNNHIIGPKLDIIFDDKSKYSHEWLRENWMEPYSTEITLPIPDPNSGIEPKPSIIKYK